MQAGPLGGREMQEGHDGGVPLPVRMPVPNVGLDRLDVHPCLVGETFRLAQSFGGVVDGRHGLSVRGEEDGVAPLTGPHREHLLGGREPVGRRRFDEGIRTNAVEVLLSGESIVPKVGGFRHGTGSWGKKS